MSAVALIGALLVIGGIVYAAVTAISRGRMSDPHENPSDTADRTLEPRNRGLGFLSLSGNWPALALIGAGLVLLLVPLLR